MSTYTYSDACGVNCQRVGGTAGLLSMLPRSGGPRMSENYQSSQGDHALSGLGQLLNLRVTSRRSAIVNGSAPLGLVPVGIVTGP